MSSPSDTPFQLDNGLSIFPYDTPRDAQVDGMETLSDVITDDGYLLLEGACGTGKTMLALAPMIEHVRSSDSDYERILVITSVKQQRWAFREAVDDINANLNDEAEPISALMLSGKADVTPFVKQGILEPDNIYETMDNLRETTRDLIDQHSGESLEEKREAARDLYQRAETSEGEFPYGDRLIPYLEENGERIEYDPYYARHLAGLYTREMEDSSFDDEQVVPFDPHAESVVTPDDLVDLAAKQAGTSPHGVMGDLLTDVEVVIANYYHVFDPMTVTSFTSELFDDNTLLVVDEAHNLVPNVRDLLGIESAFGGLETASYQLDRIRGWITGDTQDMSKAIQARAKEINSGTDISPEEMEETAELLRAVHGRLGDRIEEFIEEELGPEWWANSEFDDLTMPLRDPETMTEDNLSQWISLNPKLSKSTAKNADEVVDAAHEVYQTLYDDGLLVGERKPTTLSLRSAGNLMSGWVANDSLSFFRQVTLEETEYDPNEENISFDWENYYNAKLEVKNCIPRREIADHLDEFGGGVLMSATLQPFDVFEQVTGLDLLEDNGRTLVRERYGLPFPEENRISLAASATDFRYTNRGKPYTGYNNNELNVDNPTREEYADAILSVVETTPGNVLIAMPSYSEAEWAGDIIRQSPAINPHEVIVDESSSDHVTEDIKRRFFAGAEDGKQRVLVTGAHGTLIEGVDYDGDKLLGVAVCGVPLQSTHKPYQGAIETAYKDRFGYENGFEFAFSLPAVYKARQTIGRVIRSDSDIGARVLIDRRYTDSPGEFWASVRPLIPDVELADFTKSQPENLQNRLEAFWSYQDKH